MKRKPKIEDAAIPAVPDFKLDEFLPYRLSVAANRVSRMFAHRYSQAFGLTIPEWRVLTIVGRSGTISPSGVGELTAMDKVKVSRAAASPACVTCAPQRDATHGTSLPRQPRRTRCRWPIAAVP